MSLINDMLRDLARRGQLPAGDVTLGAGIPVTAGAPAYVSASPGADGTPWARLSLFLGTGLVVALAVAGWLYWERGHAPVENTAASLVPVAAVPVVVPAVSQPAPVPVQDTPTPPAPIRRVQNASWQSPPIHSPPIQKQVLPLEPMERAEQAYGLALEHLKAGRQADAETQLVAALAAYPAHRAARILLVSRYLGQARHGEARSVLSAAPAEERQHPSLLQLAARLALETEGEAAAIMLLDAGGATVAHTPDLASWLAALHQKQGQHAEAIERFRQSLAVRPDHGRDWLGMAISLEAQGHLDEARHAYHRARLNGLQPALARYADERLTVLPGR